MRNKLHLKNACVKMWNVEAVQPVVATTCPILQAPSAKRKHHVAELRKRGVCENAFDVFLRTGDNCCKYHRECANPHDERECVFANGKEWEEASDQVNTGDDHRCAVND